jgi:hypothetical protein
MQTLPAEMTEAPHSLDGSQREKEGRGDLKGERRLDLED